MKSAKPKFRESFGVFSPTGYVVMVFSDENSAERARQALIQNGFNSEDVTHYGHDDIMKEFEKSEVHADRPVQIGQDVAKVELYLDFAKRGCGFLVVHAPKDEPTQRAMDVARPYGLKFAEKYNRLTLQELA
jgi:hypothetical protein